MSSVTVEQGPRERRAERLFEIADRQAGYFTAKQAREAGYDYRLQHYHRERGHWIPAGHGLFKLGRYPEGENEDLARLSLWSRNQGGEPQAVASHETALRLHGLSDLMPEKTHLTVPKGFRKRLPKGVVLHKADLADGDVELLDGFGITTPLRTVLDVARSREVSPEHLESAVREAIARGLVRRKVLREELSRLGGWARATKDIDLDMPPPPAEDLLNELQEAAESDLGDFFVFRVGAPKPMMGAPLGSLRFSVEARLAGKPFTGFALDVGQGDEPLGEVEWKEGQADLTFAGIERARLPIYPLADHFAEKLHAYTRPRERRTRVKDLLDLTVILEELADDLPSSEVMRRAIEVAFDRYSTHELPRPLPPAPADWAEPFGATARDLGLKVTEIDRAHETLEEYLDDIVFGR